MAVSETDILQAYADLIMFLVKGGFICEESFLGGISYSSWWLQSFLVWHGIPLTELGTWGLLKGNILTKKWKICHHFTLPHIVLNSHKVYLPCTKGKLFLSYFSMQLVPTRNFFIKGFLYKSQKFKRRLKVVHMTCALLFRSNTIALCKN